MTLNEIIKHQMLTEAREFIQSAGMDGVSAAQVGRHIKRTHDAVRRYVNELEKAGHIERNGNNYKCLRYGPVGIRAHWTKAKKERDELPIQRWVSAANAPRIHTTAPASVWSLAA